jgi:hypothetical protein
MLTKTSDALWQALDKEGYDTTTILILADCLEEEGGNEPLWEGLRALVEGKKKPYYSEHFKEWWWLRFGGASYPIEGLLGDSLFDLLNKEYLHNRYENASLWCCPKLSITICSYARAWVLRNHTS